MRCFARYHRSYRRRLDRRSLVQLSLYLRYRTGGSIIRFPQSRTYAQRRPARRTCTGHAELFEHSQPGRRQMYRSSTIQPRYREVRASRSKRRCHSYLLSAGTLLVSQGEIPCPLCRHAVGGASYINAGAFGHECSRHSDLMVGIRKRASPNQETVAANLLTNAPASFAPAT